jgi:hypothetical protein
VARCARRKRFDHLVRRNQRDLQPRSGLERHSRMRQLLAHESRGERIDKFERGAHLRDGHLQHLELGLACARESDGRDPVRAVRAVARDELDALRAAIVVEIDHIEEQVRASSAAAPAR